MVESSSVSSSGARRQSPSTTMAAGAQKLTSSARKLLSHLEDAVAKKGVGSDSIKDTAHSLETAFRSVFGVCTSGSMQVTPDGGEDDLDLVATSGSTTEPDSSKRGEPNQKAINNNKETEGEPPKEDYGEHIYAQLFFDDQVRAAKAVKALRTQENQPPQPTKNMVKQAAATLKAPPASLKPFPVSSPVRTSPPRRGAAPLSSDELNIPHNDTFDDGISAISAHTLEAMEKRAKKLTEKTRSSESSLFPSSTRSASPELAFVKASPGPGNRSPIMLGRNQSNRSWRSKTSHSTRTTETSNSFEHWHQQEAKFWQTQVQNDAPSKRGSLLPPSHPHDSMPRELFHQQDPDRIALCLDIADDAELAEI